MNRCTEKRSVTLARQADRSSDPMSASRGCHVRLVGAEEAGPAVLHDLGRRTIREGKHRGAAGEGLDHHQAERLGPADRVDERFGPGEEVELAPAADFADVHGIVTE